MLATRTELQLALTRTDLASPNTHAAPRAQSQPTPTPRAHSPATRAGLLTEAHQSSHPQPGPQGPGPRSDLSESGAPQAPGPLSKPKLTHAAPREGGAASERAARAGARGAAGSGTARRADGGAHGVGAGVSARLGLRPARLRPLGILRPPWRQLATPAQT